jgi:phosphate transport system substrate-binding protein
MTMLSTLRITAAACCLSAAIFAPTASADDLRLVGSGASFPFPIYSKWFKDFSRAHGDIRVDSRPRGVVRGSRISPIRRWTSPLVMRP